MQKHICVCVCAEYFCFLKFVWVVLYSVSLGSEPLGFWRMSAPESACKLTGNAVMKARGLGCVLVGMYKGFFFFFFLLYSPLTVLLRDSAFYFPFCVYFRVSHCVSLFLWVFPSDLLSLFLSLLVGLQPKLVPGLGKQLNLALWSDKPSSVSLGRGCGCELTVRRILTCRWESSLPRITVLLGEELT